MGLTQKLGLLAQSVQQDTSLNIGIGGAANASYKLQVTGTTNLTGALSGTSATFSGNIAIAGAGLSAWGGTFGVLQSYYGSYFGGTTGGGTVMGNNNYYDGSNYKYINTDYAGQIQIGSGNLLFRVAPSGTAGNNVTFTNALTIASTGSATFSSSVGIGGQAPTYGGLSGLYALQSGNSSYYSYDQECGLVGNGYYSSGWKYKTSNYATRYLQNTGIHTWYTATSGTTDGALSWSEKMRISNEGNVGIGTSSPLNKLQIHSTGSATDECALRLRNPSGAFAPATTGIYFQGGYTSDKEGVAAILGGRQTAANDSYLTFWTNPGGTTLYERMRITSGGYVGIGTSSPSSPLDAYGTTGYASAWRYVITASAPDYPSIRLLANNSGKVSLIGNNNDGSMYFFVNGTATTTQGDVAMILSSNRQIVFNSAVYNNSTGGAARTLYIANDYYIGGLSSVRASKKNIENVSSINWVYQLNPVTFNYRKKDEEGNYTEETYKDLNYGLIAEDTAPIADFLINYNDKEDGSKEMVGIEYPRLIIPLLKAIQELNAKVTALENQS